MATVVDEWGGIDVYFFDQVLRGRLTPSTRFLDAGCGRGRNLLPLLAKGFDGHGSDRDPDAIAQIEEKARARGVSVDGRLRSDPVEASSHPDGHFSFILSNAVLHFAEDETHFEAMLDEMWRLLAPGGVLFARLATTITIEEQVVRTEGRWHRLPDGSDRFLADREYLREQAARVGGTEIDPVKTVHVEGMRSMTNWCLAKPAG